MAHNEMHHNQGFPSCDCLSKMDSGLCSFKFYPLFCKGFFLRSENMASKSERMLEKHSLSTYTTCHTHECFEV
ncbi:MAG: hypothetical protein J5680_00825 [Neisseriaceae bacterium]|nr:hypothetical protein [Neisseriaceae bacterium]